MSALRRVEETLIPLYAAASLLVLFLLIPLASLYLRLDPEAARKVFGSPTLAEQVRNALITSLAASAVAVAALAALGIPLAYVLARRDFPGKGLVEALVDVPFVMPHAVSGIMLLTAYGSRGLLGAPLRELGLRLEDSFAGVVAVMMFVSAPLLVDTVKAGIASVDPMVEAVARTLGAGPLRVFIDITLPMVRRHVAAGLLLAWARAMSEVGALLIVAYYPVTLNILIIEYLQVYGLPYAVAVSAAFAALAVAVLAALRRVLSS